MSNPGYRATHSSERENGGDEPDRRRPGRRRAEGVHPPTTQIRGRSDAIPQRKALRPGELEERRNTLLDAPEAGMVWEPGEEAWEAELVTLRSYRRASGHLAPRQDQVWDDPAGGDPVPSSPLRTTDKTRRPSGPRSIGCGTLARRSPVQNVGSG